MSTVATNQITATSVPEPSVSGATARCCQLNPQRNATLLLRILICVRCLEKRKFSFIIKNTIRIMIIKLNLKMHRCRLIRGQNQRLRPRTEPIFLDLRERIVSECPDC